MTTDQEYKRELMLETIYKIMILGLLAVVILVGTSAICGCQPGAVDWPAVQVDRGAVDAAILVDTPQGEVEISIVAGVPMVRAGDGWRVVSWRVTSSIAVSADGSLHVVEIAAAGDDDGRCVEGDYLSGGIHVHGQVPGMRCDGEPITVEIGAGKKPSGDPSTGPP